MKYKVGHSQKKSRFEVEIQGSTAYLEYVIACLLYTSDAADD